MDYPYKSQWDPDAAGSHEDCGPACVVSVLGAFGKSALMTDIRAFLNIPPNVGTDCNQLQQSLQHFGVPSAMVWTGTSYPKFPAVCLVKYSGFDRANVWDKNFLGWHFILVLAVTDTDVMCHDPDWLGSGGSSKIYSRREFDAAFIPYGSSKMAVVWSESVSNTPTFGTVNSDPFLRLRDAPSLQGNVTGIIANGSQVQIIGSAMDQQTPPQLWYHLQFLLSNPSLFADENMTTKLSSSMQGWSAGWLVNTGAPPPSKTPKYSISVAPTSIALGQSAVLSMTFENVDGAWLNDEPLDGSKQPVLKTVSPTQSTDYTLKVKVGSTYDIRMVPLTVTAPPTPPPAPKSVYHLGFHTLGSDPSNAISAGARLGMCMDGKENVAKYFAVGGRSMFRRYQAQPVSPEIMASDASSLPDGALAEYVNELEGQNGSSAQGILAKAAADIDYAKRLYGKNPKVRPVVGTFSTGCPDFTDPAICKAVQDGYAQWYNEGLVEWSHHLYSPNMLWIYDKPHVAGASVTLKKFMGAFGRNQQPVVYYADAPINVGDREVTDVPMTAVAAFTDNPTKQDWFETRWHFLFTRCGFDPKSTSRIWSSECGVDEGGIGGFRGHGATDQQVVDYFTRFAQLQQASILVNGVAYASPFGGACIFQLNDASNDKGHWGSYDMSLYVNALKNAGLLV